MTEERLSQFTESALAQNIWQRYVASPGVIQMKPVLHSLQHNYQWSLRRASLSADIQRRWLPSGSVPDTFNWSALPFLRAPAAPPELINRSAENVSAAQPDHSITPVEQTQISAEPLKIEHIDRKSAITSTSLASQPPSENLRTAFPVSSENVPTTNPEPGMSLSSPGFESAGMYPRVSLPGTVMEIGQQHSDEMVSRVINPEPMPIVSPNTVIQNSSQSAATIVQRHSLASLDQASQLPDAPSAIMGAGKDPIAGWGYDLPDHLSSTPQGTRAETVMTFPVQATGHIIQRTSFAIFESPTEPVSSSLPLVRPLPVHLDGSTSPGFIQAAPASDRQQQPPLVNLIQRQPQTTVAPASSPPASPAASSGTPSPGVASPSAGAVDIDKISEDILRIIMNRMAVERERRGIGLWH